PVPRGRAGRGLRRLSACPRRVLGAGGAGEHGRVAAHAPPPGGGAAGRVSPVFRRASRRSVSGHRVLRHAPAAGSRAHPARAGRRGASGERTERGGRGARDRARGERVSLDVKVPRLAESISEATLVEWLKPDGARVRADEPIATLETDKAALEIVADSPGVLTHARKLGDVVHVGDVLGRIAPGSAETAAAATSPSAT